ncbi:6-bladed beta-propeller [Chitinophaga dinghuensis]|nr:6-bladed beta-propeller [Chitinophaga dinghuensis]
MQKYRSLALLAMIASVMYGCSNNKPEENIDLSTASVLKIDKAVPEILIDSLSEQGSLTILPLETAERSLIGKVNYLYKTDSSFVVGEQNGAIKVFTTNGKFIRAIGAMGKGPFEHLTPTDIRYNDYSKNVEVMDIGLKFTGYKIAGGNDFENLELMKQYKPTLFFPLGQKKYALYNNSNVMSADDDETNRFYIIENGKATSKALPFQSTKVVRQIISANQFSNVGKTSIFYETGFPVVYTITDKLTPRYYIDFRNILPKEQFSYEKVGALIRGKEEGKFFRIFEFTEGQRFILGNIDYLQSASFFMYDKKMNKGVYTGLGFLYDKLKIRSFKIDFMDQEDTAYAVLTAVSIINAQKQLRESDPDLTDLQIRNFLALKVDTYDNPFIISFKLKQ